MQKRIFLFIIIAAAIISTAQLASIVGSTSPFTSSTAMLWNFYISLFISATTVIGLIGYKVRQKIGSARKVANLLTSLRQAALLTTVILLSLFFNTLGIVELWNIIPLIIAAVLIEFFFQAEKRPHAHLEYEQ